jgi:hypothetical protein
MSGQAAIMSASESKAVQKGLEKGKVPAMPGKELSTSSMDCYEKGGAKKKAITRKG